MSWDDEPYIKDKFKKKWMRLARQVGTDQNPCGSRQIGVVIVAPESNKVLSTGYNGPPINTPHPDTADYFNNYLWPQLTDLEKLQLIDALPKSTDQYRLAANYQQFCHDQGCPTCPRKLLKCPPGVRSELCSCQHAERNAITNAQCDLRNSFMFCWCGVPCIQCAGAIINAQIAKVYCLKTTDYQYVSRFLFKRARVEIIELTEEYCG